MQNKIKSKIILLTISWVTLFVTPDFAITAEQANTAIESFNKVYWRASNKTFYKYDNLTGELDYWMWAHAWETEMDAYERTKEPLYLQRIRDCYDGFVGKYGTTLSSNSYNDDIGWWVMAATRAYDLTGEPLYLALAKKNFDWMYANQVDTVFGGGIWWRNTSKQQKNSASTLPFSVSGFKLARQLNDPSYADKAKKLHLWVRLKLYRTYGEVADRIQRAGTRDTVFWGPLSYNHGTWVSSSWEMFRLSKDSTYFKDAIFCLEYFKNILSNKTTGILPDERGDGTGNTDNDAGMYKTVFVHYAMRFIIEGKQWQYLPWMNANAESLWKNRRLADNLMYFAWGTPAPTQSGKIGSQMATGGVALLNLLVIAEELQAKSNNPTVLQVSKIKPGFTLRFRDHSLFYSLRQKSHISFTLYTASGQYHKVLFSGDQALGAYALPFPKKHEAVGQYFLQIGLDHKTIQKQLIQIH